MEIFLQMIAPLAIAISWLDQHTTLSALVSGSLVGIFSVLFAVYIAQNWILRPKFSVDLRDITDGSGKILMINSIRHHFSSNEVFCLIAIDSEVWAKKPRIEIKEGKIGWIPLTCDTQQKNIHKRPHTVLTMSVPAMMHPNAWTTLLAFKSPDIPLEIYYTFRTKYGSFPRNDSPKVIESGKLPKIKVF